MNKLFTWLLEAAWRLQGKSPKEEWAKLNAERLRELDDYNGGGYTRQIWRK